MNNDNFKSIKDFDAKLKLDNCYVYKIEAKII